MHDDRSAGQATVEFDPKTETYRTEYLDGVDPPSEVVVRALAAISGKDPTEIDPLHRTVEADALDALFRPPRQGTPRGDGEVLFIHGGYRVAVRSYGIIEIQPTEDTD